MKKYVKLLLLCIAMCSNSDFFAQATQTGLGFAGHSPLFGGVPLRYCGWDASPASNTIPFNLEHRGTQRINFLTGGINRMTILGTASGATAGFVGIGNGFTAPQSLFHVNDGIGAFIQVTDIATGSLGTDGLRLGVLGSNAILAQQEANNLFFNTAGLTIANQRMMITGAVGPNQGFVGIGTNFQTPQSLLNINAFNNSTGNVFRTDGPNNLDNIWQLFSGPNPAANIEKFRLSNPTTTNDINLHLVQDGNMSFFTGGFTSGSPGSNQRMIVYGSAATIPGMVQIFENNATINSNTTTLQVGGPIETNALHNVSSDHTVLFGYTNPTGDPGTYTGGITDGFRVRYLESLKGSNGDALVFTKTDINSVIPDGCIAFTNQGAGASTQDVLSMKIEGNGNVGIGPTFSSGGTLPPRAARRLEVLTNLSTPNTPCVRYSYQQVNGAASPGRFVDFTETATGDYIIASQDRNLITSNTPNKTFSERFVGINTITPGNTLEINSQYAGSSTPNGQPASTFGAPTGWAGLRFSDLQSTSISEANPGTGVLSVDASGDVIYVPGGTGTLTNADNGTSLNGTTVELGNNVGLLTAQLINNREIPMMSKNIMFNDNALSASSIGIGLPLGTAATTLGKFEVFNDAKQGAGVYTTQGTSSSPLLGITARVTNSGSGNATAINGTSLGSSGGIAIGVNGNSSSASVQNIAINGNARNATSQSFAANLDVLNSSSPQNYGVQVEVIGGTNSSSINFGGQFDVTNNGSQNIGVMGSASGATVNYSIYGNASSAGTPGAGTPTGPNYAGYFNGDVYISGTYGPSDINLKDSIQDITNAMAVINQLNPKTFEFKHAAYPSMNLPKGLQYGLIAQEVQPVLPALITDNVQPAVLDTLGNVVIPAVNFKGLEYQQLIPILLKGIKEQQSKIDSLDRDNHTQDSINHSLQNQINLLSDMINSCCSSGHQMQSNSSSTSNGTIGLNVNLKDGQSIVLEQNVPNPFAEQTTINYYLPDNTGKAQMLFYNAQGKLIQSTELTQKGKGQLNVFASDLSNGIYTYTLIVDGKIIETKKMMKQQ